MKTFKLQILPLSAFGTELIGDTLFGQLCWAIHHRYGDAKLKELLVTYTEDTPFCVISDAFPANHLPLPTLPGQWFSTVDEAQRKSIKKQVWLPVEKVSQPIAQWQQSCKTSKELLETQEELQPHNTINRMTGTTGEAVFAPYAMQQNWYQPGTVLDIYVLLDDSKLSADEIRQCFEDIGAFGYGRDASIGLGKFQVKSFAENSLPEQENPNACLTLAPCAPQGLGFNKARSFYQRFTRFGKHGDTAIHQSGQPFKNPVLMARSGAVFSTEHMTKSFIGKGLGGDGILSKTIPETVHQAYAPIVRFHLPPTPEQSQ